MIYLLHGENLFRRDLELARITNGMETERYIGSEIDQSRLVDVMAGGSLFSSQRVIIIDGLSANKSIWTVMADQVSKLDEATSLILVEDRLDRRTKTYKLLQRQAKLIDCSPWTLRQTSEAEAWVREYATRQKVGLTPDQVRELVARAVRPGANDQPIIDQALLATVISQLRHAPEVTHEIIDAVMAHESHDNVFGLMEAALSNDHLKLNAMIERLKHHQDGHRVMALLSSQGLQLAGLILARSSGVASAEQVAGDLGAHPYALSQLSRLASQMSVSEAKQVISALADADKQLKRSAAKPWTLIKLVLAQMRTT